MDMFSKEKRSEIMSRIRSKDTKPELALRKALWARGWRYRLNYGKEKIDIAFVSRKVAVFVDGCFWHMCPKHGRIPETNREYWEPKLRRNVERDKRNRSSLRRRGWKVVRVWEHELKSLERVVRKIEKALESRRS